MNHIKTASVLLIFFTLLTGFIYPMTVTAMAQLLFPWKANGSLLEQQGKTVGSALIGQLFDAPNYFWGRPSATTPHPYNAANSSGSNRGPSNPDFLKTVQKRLDDLRQQDPTHRQVVPADLVTASGSGLDPEISILAALYQVPRVAKANQMNEADLESLVNQMKINRTLGLFGEPRINVLQLNMALDKWRHEHDGSASQPR